MTGCHRAAVPARPRGTQIERASGGTLKRKATPASRSKRSAPSTLRCGSRRQRRAGTRRPCGRGTATSAWSTVPREEEKKAPPAGGVSKPAAETACGGRTGVGGATRLATPGGTAEPRGNKSVGTSGRSSTRGRRSCEGGLADSSRGARRGCSRQASREASVAAGSHSSTAAATAAASRSAGRRRRPSRLQGDHGQEKVEKDDKRLGVWHKKNKGR